MTPDLLACVDRSLAAERAGDAVAALEWHQAVPQYRKNRHRPLLARLVALGDRLPEWVWARWIVYQSTRCEDGETGALIRYGRQALVEHWHADLLDECFAAQGDPVKVVAQVLGESWIFHQLVPHEVGGLGRFVEEFATGRLAEHAELALSWAGARMGGYRVGESRPGTHLRVTDADTGEQVDVLDIGAGSCGRDAWVLGRLVPSGVGDMLMFDTPPLAVPEEVAVAVAGRPEGRWMHPLHAALGAGLVSGADLLREDYELTTDVTELELLRWGTPPRDYDRVMRQLRSGRDEVSRAAFRVLLRAHGGDVAPADQAYVGAAVLNPTAVEEMRRLVARSGPGFLGEWVDLVAEPARGRLGAMLP